MNSDKSPKAQTGEMCLLCNTTKLKCTCKKEIESILNGIKDFKRPQLKISRT